MGDSASQSLADWHRILLGQEPPTYFLELLLRAVVVYVVLMVSMRLLGKRMSSQLSRTEMAAMVSLAAAIGVPMLSSDRGLLPAVVVGLVVVLVGRTIATLSRRSGGFETAVQGALTILVEDGRMNVDGMKQTRVTRERVCAQLRGASVYQLGLVERLYLEASGAFTLIRAKTPVPGLSIVPDWDREFVATLRRRDDRVVCSNCGHTPPPAATRGGSSRCPNCGFNHWLPAVE